MPIIIACNMIDGGQSNAEGTTVEGLTLFFRKTRKSANISKRAGTCFKRRNPASGKPSVRVDVVTKIFFEVRKFVFRQK